MNKYDEIKAKLDALGWDGDKAIEALPELLKALDLILPYIPRDQMTYSEGDHGERVYHSDMIRTLLSRLRPAKGGER